MHHAGRAEARRRYIPEPVIMSVLQVRLLLAMALIAVPACNLLVPIALVGKHTRTVLPEFDKLPGKRVAVLVWTDPATLFDYPYARFELATYVSDKLRMELAERKQQAEIVDARDVEDFLQKNLDARVDPQLVGKHFRADYVIYLEVLAFQIRDPDEPQFLRGRIESSVEVYEIAAEGTTGERFLLTPVLALYPERSPVLLDATNAPLVRESTYRAFAEQVARKFYEYEIQL